MKQQRYKKRNASFGRRQTEDAILGVVHDCKLNIKSVHNARY